MEFLHNITKKSSSFKYNFLCIGDTHFKIQNLSHLDLYINEIQLIVEKYKPNFIILLGDILDTHEYVHTLCFNYVQKLFEILRSYCEIYILVGNHDYINNSQFLTTNHCMNALKKWDRIHIIDNVYSLKYNNDSLILLPYVPPGRFEEALENIKDWKSSDIILCHQEFYGCKMGAITSSIGDKWEKEYPLIISGHIHDQQIVQNNIVYTGSSMQHSFGENNKKYVVLCECNNDNINLYNIKLDLPTKKIISMSLDDIKTIKRKDNEQIRVNLKGSLAEFKQFKKSKDYKKWVKDGIKIVHKPDLIEFDKKTKNTDIQQKDFNNILYDLVYKNDDLLEIYKEIIN
jgi:DNA repair exonuclease SbcCD nuclease subunit